MVKKNTRNDLQDHATLREGSMDYPIFSPPPTLTENKVFREERRSLIVTLTKLRI